jgi:hypothetical protein
MNFILDFESMPDYVLLRTNGSIEVEGVDKMMNDLLNSLEWITGSPQIVDHRELDLTGMAADEMKDIWGIIKNHSERLGDGPCAFVVGDELGFGFARMYDLLGGDSIHSKVEIFYSFKDALYWIKSLK